MMIHTGPHDRDQRGSARFVGLLLGLFLMFLAAPVAWWLGERFGSAWAQGIVIVIFSLNMVFAAAVAAQTRRERVVAWGLAILAVVTYGISVSTPETYPRMIAHGIGLLFLVHVIVVVLRYVFRARRVTWDTISAACCVYLMAGIAFALLYAILAHLEPGSFTYNGEVSAAQLQHSSFLLTALYYSLITMTTLGYGDVVPTLPTTQMAAALQAVLGQLYVAILVARLVGVHVATAQDDAAA